MTNVASMWYNIVMPVGKQLDYIKQAQIIKGLAAGIYYKKLSKEIGVSDFTIRKYEKVFAKEIEEARTSLRNKILETGDKEIAGAFLNIANLATEILQKNLKKYNEENRELKPGELSYISVIGATAVDKNRVIENKPSNINKNPVVFNFTVYKKEEIKPAEVIAEAVSQIEDAVIKEEPLLEENKRKSCYSVKPESIFDPVDKSAYKSKNQKFTVVTRYRQPDGTFSDKESK